VEAEGVELILSQNPHDIGMAVSKFPGEISWAAIECKRESQMAFEPSKKKRDVAARLHYCLLSSKIVEQL
jgi:hypothetical protein